MKTIFDRNIGNKRIFVVLLKRVIVEQIAKIKKNGIKTTSCLAVIESSRFDDGNGNVNDNTTNQ